MNKQGFVRTKTKMENHTVLYSILGIAAIILFVAGLTFYEDGKKWFRLHLLRRRRKQKYL